MQLSAVQTTGATLSLSSYSHLLSLKDRPSPGSIHLVRFSSYDPGLGTLPDITGYHRLGPLLIRSISLPLSPCYLLQLLSHCGSSKHRSLFSSPQATHSQQTTRCQQTKKMTVMCSVSSIESLHVWALDSVSLNQLFKLESIPIYRRGN